MVFYVHLVFIVVSGANGLAKPESADHPLPAFDADDALLALDNVVTSAHAMNWTDELMIGFGEINVKVVLDVMHGRAPRSVVNAKVLESGVWRRKAAALSERFGET